jgi:hypothetical protein
MYVALASARTAERISRSALHICGEYENISSTIEAFKMSGKNKKSLFSQKGP